MGKKSGSGINIPDSQHCGSGIFLTLDPEILQFPIYQKVTFVKSFLINIFRKIWVIGSLDPDLRFICTDPDPYINKQTNVGKDWISKVLRLVFDFIFQE